ncbi:peptidoglycan-binding protein [Pseudooceanicola atlanticus]|uniref:Peptidoglycan-binding protein n=1 Tax=Pseudooceanicola atlanticus TaxID=1461694 RepID=A0A0A0EC90_9RHOB|nr:peptidoglycan-binding protein [Pseudooceanicola atlanticus]
MAFQFQAIALRAQSDEVVWVQIEAQPSLALAEDAIRSYSESLQDVNGFALGGGWYGIALGPYARDDADRVLQVLRREGAIPRDSYIAFASSFRQQFWPRGENQLADTAAAQPSLDSGTAEPEQSAEAAPVVAPETEPEPDETPAEARRSEALLTRDERMELQVALKWAGYYNAAIDGAFGRGTRGSMAGWQQDNGYEPTGILTTMQRSDLMRQYNAVLEDLGLELVTDTTAGIRLLMPMDVVAFDRYEAPFAHYSPTGDINARLILISQEGDQKTLFGLYDILQTLAIIPEDGPRERSRDGFTIVGENARIVSHTEVSLRNGQIKGWTLVWPSGDEERRTRLLGEMQQSYEPVPGVMPAAMGADSGQSIDLLSGLEIRKPILSRSGFYVDQRGTVLTSSEAVAQCGRVTLDKKTEAEVVLSDAASGVAVLRPATPIAPMGHARFATAVPRLQSDVAAAGYPYEGRLAAPTLNFGKLEELQGLSGETGVERLSLNALPGDAGGPVMDQGGAVIGMVQPAQAEGRQLPPGVAFAVDNEVLVSVLGQAGLSAQAAEPDRSLAPEDLTRIGMAMTVLVSCWE